MPAANSRKTYAKDTYYHVYNRGVEKRILFEEDFDYHVFLKYLKEYLTPQPDKKEILVDLSFKGQAFKGIPRQPKNYLERIELVAFCLMPNHFHLLIKNNDTRALPEFMQSISTRYTMYFNKKYDRVGSLFQNRYKAATIQSDSYLLHLSRYIHLNPSEYTNDIIGAYSSYAIYLDKVSVDWVSPEIILKQFNNPTLPEINKYNTYKKFVEDHKRDSGEVLGKLVLE